MTEAFSLTVALQRSPLDARRGVVRVHPQVLEMLAIDPWDPVALEGERVTGALVAASGPLVPRSSILMDDLVCSNAGVKPGASVRIVRTEAPPAVEVVVQGASRAEERLDPFAVRFALLGKVVTAGDRVSLMPQDFARPEVAGLDLETLVRYLTTNYGNQWKTELFDVTSVDPPGLARITMETIVIWDQPGRGGLQKTTGSATPLADPATPQRLPGHEATIARLTEILDLGWHHRDVLGRLGSRPQMGVLITGPAGSGKVAVVRAVAAGLGARVVELWAPTLARSEMQDAEEALAAAISQAHAFLPSVVLIEDVEALAPKEEAGPMMDLLIENIRVAADRGQIAIVCTTAHPGSTNPALRARGVLDHEIEITIPTKTERREILEVLTHSLPLASDVDLQEIANRTPGFVAADLLTLCREASLRAAQRAVAAGEKTSAAVTNGDLEAALEVVKPSSLEGVSLQIAGVTLDDVGDMEQTKKELTEAVVWPLRFPETFERLGVAPARGVLLYGPPGCGKTFLVRAIANSAEANFMSVKGAELLSKWVGESERGVRELFRKARSVAPTIVFFDEIDALAPARGSSSDGGATDRVVAQLLTELDGVEDLRDVFVLAATNRPDLIDPALLRPGRLERLVYVPPPDAEARAAILAAATKDMPLADDVDLPALAASCEGFSGADLEALARQAALAAMRASIQAPRIEKAHFAQAHAGASPSIKPEHINALEAFAARRTSAENPSPRG